MIQLHTVAQRTTKSASRRSITFGYTIKLSNSETAESASGIYILAVSLSTFELSTKISIQGRIKREEWRERKREEKKEIELKKGENRFSLVARIYTPGQIQTAWMFARTLSFDYWESQLKTFVMFNSL